jgi:branched-chain amino acid transport system substrate-binding protein
MTPEQVRWGLENLNLTQAKLDALGFGVMRPVSTSCSNHVGADWARIHTWDGSKWAFTSVRLVSGRQADHQAAGQEHGEPSTPAEKKLAARTPADCQSPSI